MRICLLLFLCLASCAVVDTAPPPPPPRTAPGARAPAGIPSDVVPAGLGVNIHFVEPQARDLDMIAAAGFRWVRMDFFWERIEREKGVYDFTAYERLVDALAARGIRPLFILDYGNPHYDGGLAPHTDEGRRAFARFAAAGVAKFKGRGILWELWNEPNAPFWKPAPNIEHYMALAKAVFPAMRQADPGATLVAPAAAVFDLKFLERCFERGLLDLIDAVSVHPYGRNPPEQVEPDYHRLRVLIARYAPEGKERMPVLSGEWGYSMTWFSAEQQAQFLARTFLLNLANGVPVSIWYDWHDDGPNPQEPENNYGTVRWGYEPKPSYHAAQTLIHELKGFRFVKRLPLPSEEDYAALFSDGRAHKVALWTVGAPHRVTLPIEVSSGTLVGMTGESRRVSTSGSELALEISGSPQYLTPAEPSNPLRLAEAWRVESRPWFRAGVAATHARAPRLVVIVKNPLRRSLRGSVEASIPREMTGGWQSGPDFDLEPGQSTRLVWQGKAARREDRTFRVPVTLRLEGRRPLRQELTWGVTNPLRVRPALQHAETSVEVENPSGEPFVGTVALQTGEGGAPTRIPVRLARGERRRTLRVPDGTPVGMQSVGRWERRPLRLSLSLSQEDQTGPVSDAVPFTFRSLEPFDTQARAEAYSPVFEGDPSVGANVTLRVVEAPGRDRPVTRALRIEVGFGAGWRFMRLTPKQPLPLPGKPKEIGMWVYNTADTGDVIRCRFVDARGGLFQPTASQPLTWKGWRWVTMPLDEASTGHISGYFDARVGYPIRLDTLFLLDSSRKAHTSTVYLGGVTLLYEGEAPD